MDTTNRYQVIDARTGAHTRKATESEARACKAAGLDAARAARNECREYGHDWRGYEGERSEHGHLCAHCGATR